MDYVKSLVTLIPKDRLLLAVRSDHSAAYQTDKKIRGASIKLLNYFSFYNQLSNWLNTLDPQSYVVLMPGFHPLNYHIIKLSHKLGFTTQLIVHDYILHEGEKKLWVNFLQKLSIKVASHIYTLTEFVKSQIISDYGNLKSISVWPIPAYKTTIKNALEHSKNPRILFFGRIKKYKGVHLLIEAVRDLQIEQLTIAGQGDLPDISERKKIKVINNNIDDQLREKLFLSHHIIVLPYLTASQSGVLRMAYGHGMVIICTKVGGLVEQVSESSVLWCEPNALSIRKSIQRVITDKNLYAQLKDEVIKASEF